MASAISSAEGVARARAGLAGRLRGLHALYLYALGSRLAGAWHRLRHGRPKRRDAGRLKSVPWSRVLERRPIRLVETRKAHGNVRLSELGVLALAAAQVRPGRHIVEIGTFDGRTTLNMALNAPLPCEIVTLDLPPTQETVHAMSPADRRLVEKPACGQRLRDRDDLRACTARVRQVYGDSASFDFSAYYGLAGLVFVDGSHARPYVLADSASAGRMAAEGGLVLWHDYGVWSDVTQALDEMADRGVGLRKISGTSLVVWRCSEPGRERLLSAVSAMEATPQNAPGLTRGQAASVEAT